MLTVMKEYAFYTNETDHVHYISGYSVFDAMDMLELAGFTVAEYVGQLLTVNHAGIDDRPSYETWALETYGYIP